MPFNLNILRDKPSRPRKEGRVRTLMNSWWDRLLGGVSNGGFAQQEAQYASHRTTRDYIWNTELDK